MDMKGLIRKEWYSLWSQYRIHMLAMLGLGILLPLLKDTDFFFDESFWMYCAALTLPRSLYTLRWPRCLWQLAMTYFATFAALLHGSSFVIPASFKHASRNLQTHRSRVFGCFATFARDDKLQYQYPCKRAQSC